MICFTGHTAAVRALLGAGAAVGAKLPDGSTALHVAAAAGHVATVGALLANDAEPDATDRNHWTPLHHAAINGKGGAVKARGGHIRFPVFGVNTGS